MRVLHTSDWHLGRSLFGQKRYEEFSAFLDWLARTLQEKEVDVLVVSGDIFDSGTPSNRAQRLYYDFLRQVYLSSCRHVVITAGNHDSPSMLGASREILQVLDVHVVGNLPEDPTEEIKVLRDAQGKVALIVCAVPFLRDADMRLVEEGESSGDKESKMQEAIRRHYAQVLEEAAALRAEIRAMNVDLARLPKVYDNIQGTPGVWVVIDPGAKTLQLQNGETIARLPRR